MIEAEESTRPLIVGERTNVIGSREFKKLVAAEQWEEATEIARRQVKSGAHIVDVCLQSTDREEINDRLWSVLTVGLIHMYDPEVVVIGGSVMKREAEILPKMQQYVKEHAWTPNRTVPLRSAVLGSNAALLGALPLVEYGL